jgi:hypothetical protein
LLTRLDLIARRPHQICKTSCQNGGGYHGGNSKVQSDRFQSLCPTASDGEPLVQTPVPLLGITSSLKIIKAASESF